MSKLLFKEDMDSAGCDDPGCTHDHSVLYLHAQCHPRTGCVVRYKKEEGQMIVSCLRCGNEVVRFVPATAHSLARTQ